MYEVELEKLMLRRKELMSKLTPLYEERKELEANGGSVAELNINAKKINPMALEVNAIDARIKEIKEANSKASKKENNPEVNEVESCKIVEKEPTVKKYLTKGGIFALVLGTLGLGVGTTLLGQKLFKNKNCAGKCVNYDYEQTVETDVVRKDVTVDTKVTSDKTVVTKVTTNKTAEPTPSTTIEPTAEPTAAAQPSPTVEPGLDPTNEYSVENAVDRIYAEDLNPMIQGLNNPAFEAQVTRADIADIVRFVNGELPLNKKYNEGTFTETASKFIYIYGAQGGHKNELYPVHFSNLCDENSTLSKYCAEYDAIYNKIAEYRAEGNVAGFIEEVGSLTTKLYNEWHLQGMYGGWNPYLFTREEKFLAFNAAIGRYTNYVKEYLVSNDLTICIDACVDVENNKYKQVETRDIYEAMLHGTSINNEISIMIGNQVLNPNELVSNELKDVLNEKSQQAVKKLN